MNSESPNLERDLLDAEWLLEKVRAGRRYAQNLYAALCNNDFQKLDVFPILKEETWSCSWRHAGRIIADMRGRGESYMDWYCSSMGNIDPKLIDWIVSEGEITPEVKADLRTLGWVPTNV